MILTGGERRKTKLVVKKTRSRDSAELKTQALARVEKDGVGGTAGDLGLSESQLAFRRSHPKPAPSNGRRDCLAVTPNAPRGSLAARAEQRSTGVATNPLRGSGAVDGAADGLALEV